MGLHSHCSPRSWSTSPSAALGLECIVPSLGAADGGLRHPAEFNPAVEVGVAAHVDAALERGVVARGVAPGAAHHAAQPLASWWPSTARMGLGSGQRAQTYARRQLEAAATAPLQGCARRPPAHPWRGGGGCCGVVGHANEGGGREQPRQSAAA